MDILKNEEMAKLVNVALINVGTSRLGATLPSSTAPAVREWAESLGLILASTGGLTTTGSIMRDRAIRRALDAAF